MSEGAGGLGAEVLGVLKADALEKAKASRVSPWEKHAIEVDHATVLALVAAAEAGAELQDAWDAAHAESGGKSMGKILEERDDALAERDRLRGEVERDTWAAAATWLRDRVSKMVNPNGPTAWMILGYAEEIDKKVEKLTNAL